MEAVFRRGPDWEEGREVLLLLEAAAAAGVQSQQSFLRKLAELAELCGALPVSYGPTCSWQWRKVSRLSRAVSLGPTSGEVKLHAPLTMSLQCLQCQCVTLHTTLRRDINQHPVRRAVPTNPRLRRTL